MSVDLITGCAMIALFILGAVVGYRTAEAHRRVGEGILHARTLSTPDHDTPDHDQNQNQDQNQDQKPESRMERNPMIVTAATAATLLALPHHSLQNPPTPIPPLPTAGGGGL